MVASTRSRGWKVLLSWTALTVVGFAAGAACAWWVNPYLGEILAACAAGAVVGAAQWLILRKLFPWVGSWILATALGFPLGLSLFNLVQGADLGDMNYIVRLVLGIAACSLVIALAGWLALHRAIPGSRRSLWWFPLTVLGWLLGGFAVFYLGPSLPEPFILVADYAIIGLLVGVLTGAGVLIILRRMPDGQEKPQKGAVYMTATAIAVALVASISIWEYTVHNPTVEPPQYGSVPACKNLPPRDCSGDEAYCGELIAFEPSSGAGYLDYPVNGETWENQYRSYARRELVMLVQHVAARVACETAGWDYRPYMPIGLGDMSEADGAIPGASIGDLGHLPGTHEMGTMMDLAYFQNDPLDSRMREKLRQEGLEGDLLGAICQDSLLAIGFNHCIQAPHLLDPWRTALFIARLAESPRLRVVGVDGQVGPMIEKALDALVQAGWVDAGLREKLPFIYETVNEGLGWYFFHNHHWHMALEEK